jgi:hypothetical protein
MERRLARRGSRRRDFSSLSAPVAFRRFDRDGVAIDLTFKPFGWDGACNALSLIWAKRLNLGEYNRIELQLDNGGKATIRAKS